MAKKTNTTRSKAGASRKKTAKKSTRKAASRSTASRSSGASAEGKQLVIVESPAKARTINKYLGPDFVVKASVGHVRDLPAKAPKVKKGEKKQPVPGVDLDRDFRPHYEVLPRSQKVVNELKRDAKKASDVWFATDLDREGEAIAWHLATELGIDPAGAKRVVFNAITRDEIRHAFDNPHSIDLGKVNAQQARRILDRIVGYQVSPLLWKKVARGLSAGRVQSVAVRLVVEREREIRAFVPDETWRFIGRFTGDPAAAGKLQGAYADFAQQKDAKGNTPTIKAENAWLAGKGAVRAELVEVGGRKFEVMSPGRADAEPADLTPRITEIARLVGMTGIETTVTENPDGKGPARRVRTVTGSVETATPYKLRSLETKRTKSRPSPPFITSTLQQAASSRLGFGAQRTMRTAQGLYEGVELAGEGSVGLITYMRTDSTHLANDAVEMARGHIKRTWGDRYLPDKPVFYKSSNKAAQEAHEAIRPTDPARTPDSVRGSLTGDQFKLYQLIWSRFLACQMTPAEWDSTTALIEGGTDPQTPVVFKTSGRILVFDGFYRAMGVPTSSDEQTLPEMAEAQPFACFSAQPEQRFTSPPARYSEASLIKMLESEGIGRPSTYASIIQVIQDRKYVEQLERRFYATDLGEVVTDKLIEAFPNIMEVGYTRDLEGKLDKIEEEHTDWIQTLHDFYGPFQESLELAHENLTHAKAETQPAPKEYRCADCGADMVYRFGKSGRFLSCSRYPDCKYASPCDREGRPQPIENANVKCHQCGAPMIKRTGRFGPFFGCSAYPECDGILKADKQGRPLAPQPPALETDIPCPKCQDRMLNLRNGARGPWLSCSGFPKCRGRGKWKDLDDATRAHWEKALADHEKRHPVPIITDLEGKPLTDAKGKPIETEQEEEPIDVAA
ncbi:MAG: type I DNA topoisomerase [Phycisphaeraceae bacterium]|nr:type I DNA topoisomerase [Phycisphaeraceae bacterium]MCB9848343.1 type I DNA topoisomerase [Phycisphaeraceae bacterium]